MLSQISPIALQMHYTSHIPAIPTSVNKIKPINKGISANPNDANTAGFSAKNAKDSSIASITSEFTASIR